MGSDNMPDFCNLDSNTRAMIKKTRARIANSNKDTSKDTVSVEIRIFGIRIYKCDDYFEANSKASEVGFSKHKRIVTK